jgi:hypothetical protein
METKRNASQKPKYLKRGDLTPFLGATADTWKMRMQVVVENLLFMKEIIDLSHPYVKKWKRQGSAAYEVIKALHEQIFFCLGDLTIRDDGIKLLTHEAAEARWKEFLKKGPDGTTLDDWRDIQVKMSEYEEKA